MRRARTQSEMSLDSASRGEAVGVLVPGRMDGRRVGHAFAPFVVQADARRLRCFAEATGKNDPVYFDADVAGAAGHPALPLPPTFLVCLEMDAPDPNALLTLLGLDPRQRLLHAEQGLVFHRMAYCGDRLAFSQRLDQVYDKKGGALQFAVRSTRVTNQRDELVAELRCVLVAVHAAVPAPAASALTGSLVPSAVNAAPDARLPEQGAEALPTLETAAITRFDLALYAGASGDHNPVHVDLDFARAAGFDDVFAHGMLVMAYAARGLTDWVPQRRLRALHLRFQSMTHIGDRLRCAGRITGRTEPAGEALQHIGLSVCDARGVVKASGRATVTASR